MRTRVGFSLWLVLGSLLLSGCLTRKNALPTHRPNRTAAKGVIATDASSAPRGIHTSRAGLLNSYAQVLGVHPRELQNAALYQYIDDWMGVPHRTGGTDRRGVDCSAFVGMLMREVYGKSLPRVSRDMAEQVKRKYERQLREGDLVFFSFSRKNIDHVGIYLHNRKFVHVSTTKGVIISDLHDTWYYKYFTRAGSVK
ncbi:lipoprotein Spr [Parapedobacter composti]|uniref:Lipoprotein Spr n=1 Tax=Parapedobacter composti TaxID=623281 RepID=A0A1I1GH76_9SPHI|nr:NlpC/P60 family protein [Parapedobacter composti]SFC11129.1 lipoprotein Spr [Parapedobacter composti]